ncbi:MAG: hypothetical protein PWP08_1624 [Methanofollis sp.]|nr:hypothetical protein [Methanofollis sp.]
MKIALPRKFKVSRNVLVGIGIVILVALLLFAGWNLYKEMDRAARTASLNEAIAGSQADLLPLNADISDLLTSLADRPSTAACDAYMLRLRALADQGAVLTAVHRNEVAGVDAPLSVAAAQGAYLDALDSLHDAFSSWAAASDAYFRYDYDGAQASIDEADLEWQAYQQAVADYDRIADEG